MSRRALLIALAVAADKTRTPTQAQPRVELLGRHTHHGGVIRGFGITPFGVEGFGT